MRVEKSRSVRHIVRPHGLRAALAGSAVVFLTAGWAPLLWAHFEQPLLSTRTASLGGAFVAIADDPSAVVDNPAGLCGLPTLSLLATYNRPFGVEGLDEGYLAAALPVPAVSVGLSWFHRGLSGALSEDLLTLAVGRDIRRTSEDASLSVGVSVDVARVAAHGEWDASTTVAAFGGGVLLRPFAFIGLGYSVRNLGEPEVDLVAEGGGTTLASSQAVGLAYYWQDRLMVTIETRQDAAGGWRNRGGAELRVGRHLALRAGLDSSHAAVGTGVTWQGFAFDAGMTGHEALGATYVLTLRYSRPQAVTPYGTSR